MQKKFNRFLNLNTLLPVLAVIVAVSWVWSTVSVLQRNFDFQQQVDNLEQEIALLELQNKAVEYQIAYYKTEEAAELAARKNTTVAAEGEKILVVPKSQFEGEEDSKGTPATATEFSQSNFEQWKFFLLGGHTE